MAVVKSKNLTVPLSIYAYLDGGALHIQVFAGETDLEGTLTVISLASLLKENPKEADALLKVARKVSRVKSAP